MPDFYLSSFVGVKDGTKIPADRANGQLVGAKMSSIIGSKPAGVAYAAADQIYLGTLRAGESLREIKVTSDTTLGTTTLSVGPKSNTTKYANARTMTTVDTPTLIGPRGTAAANAPLTADEDIWLTLGVGGIASGINVTIELVIASVK
jgi:hypothetical protein